MSAYDDCNCQEKRLLNGEASLEDLILTRRHFLAKAGMGMGALTLGSILGFDLLGSSSLQAESLSPLAPKAPHFPGKAKAVIHIFAEGAPSHIDTFDPKPLLAKYEDKSLPGLDGLAFPSPFKFRKCGKSGIEVSEVFPKLGECVDDMAIIRSLWTDIPAHDIAQRFMHTGSLQLPKPSLGSWVLYGLGSVNQNMPGFICLGGSPEWRSSSFLSGAYQGCVVDFNSRSNPEQILQNIHSRFLTSDRQRRQLDLSSALNDIYSKTVQEDSQFEARVQSFEMAFKMQTEATDAFDISKESEETKALYGMSPSANFGGGKNKKNNSASGGEAEKHEMGAKLLVARRLVERGVRFVQIKAGGWDHHEDIDTKLPKKAGEIDGAAAGLIKDLKQRGLLDSTLVIWGGEFGRTVVKDRNGNKVPGRDHNGRAFCTWMAGGGVKGGTVYGSTDEFGNAADKNKVHVHDLHATILHLLGFDHTKLTYRYNGRDFRLTDNYGEIVRGVLT